MFSRFASRTADAMGHPLAFFFALLSILVWGLIGPLAGWSDTWQLVINTATTIITFLMVFLIQNTQNEDTKEIKAMLEAMTEKFGLEAAKEEKLS